MISGERNSVSTMPFINPPTITTGMVPMMMAQPSWLLALAGALPGSDANQARVMSFTSRRK